MVRLSSHHEEVGPRSSPLLLSLPGPRTLPDAPPDDDDDYDDDYGEEEEEDLQVDDDEKR